MEHIEMIEKLREKAGITREEAADALTRANWDMLEALVILEREGKVKPLTSSVVTASPQAYSSYGQNGANGTYSSYGTYDPNTPGSSYGTRGPSGPSAGDRLKALFESPLPQRRDLFADRPPEREGRHQPAGLPLRGDPAGGVQAVGGGPAARAVPRVQVQRGKTGRRRRSQR